MCVSPRLLDVLVSQQTAHLQAQIEALTARIMQTPMPQAEPVPSTTTTPPPAAAPAEATQPIPAVTSAPEPLTPDELAELAELIAANREFIRTHGCLHCGGLHVRTCPRIKSQILRGAETTEVEYWPPGTWEHLVIFLDNAAMATAPPVTAPSGTPAIPPPSPVPATPAPPS